MGEGRPGGERVLELERELQSLRLELAEHKRANEKLSLELERQRVGESARLAAVQIEKILTSAGGIGQPVVDPGPSFESGGPPGPG
jgi:hypothetical protein